MKICMRREVRVGMLLLAAVCAGAQSAAPASADQLMDRASQAVAAGRFEDAEKLLHLVLEREPNLAPAHMGLGVVELRLGKTLMAIEDLQAALAVDAHMPGAHLFLGIADVQLHKLDEARLALRAETAENPRDAQGFMWLGVVEMQAGNPDAAIAPLDRAAELAPQDASILEYRGKAHSDVAYESYARMTALDPDSWHVHKVQAQMYAAQKQHKDAIEEYRKAVEKAPHNSDLYEELGNEYRSLGLLDQAREAYGKELELSPNNPIAEYNLARIEIETDAPEAGVERIKSVIATYQNIAATYFYYGLGLFETGKTGEALKQLEHAQALHPEADLAPRVAYELGRVYKRLGRNDDAVRAMQDYEQLKAENAKSHASARVGASAEQGR